MTEQRVALVLNGGVSLAVWMAGVVYEIDLLRRASNLPDNGEDSPDGPAMARWQKLCGTSSGDGRKVVVDIIAGTSAGGLNGTMLAKAIAQGGTLNPTNKPTPWLKTMWLKAASLTEDTLLANDDGPASLLSGNYFSTTINEHLDQLNGQGPRGPMSLFITATAMDPSDRAYVDGYGGTFNVPDHRRVYRFERTNTLKYHPEKWNPNTPGSGFEADPVDHFTQCAPLSLAARASASFPVAFPAVRETPELAANRVLPSDSNGRAWLLDGGILDNAPFAPVLEAMAQRPLRGDARRTLIYVVPSNGGAAATLIDPDKGGPTWPQVAAASMSFPRGRLPIGYRAVGRAPAGRRCHMVGRRSLVRISVNRSRDPGGAHRRRGQASADISQSPGGRRGP